MVRRPPEIEGAVWKQNRKVQRGDFSGSELHKANSATEFRQPEADALPPPPCMTKTKRTLHSKKGVAISEMGRGGEGMLGWAGCLGCPN